MSVKVIVDSVASIPADLVSKFDLGIASLFVHAGDADLAEVDLDVDEFYTRLPAMKEIPTSAQPSVEAMAEMFDAAARAGRDVVGVFISEKMSGTIQSARLAATMVSECHPEWRYALVDSTSNSMQEGSVALAAARVAAQGGSLGECESAALDCIPRTRFIFSPEGLDYLRKGGRIGGASALLGSMLQIRPILTVANGETQTLETVRTVKKALARMVAQFSEDITRCGLVEVYVHYIGDPGPALEWAREAIEPLVGRPVRALPVSPVIGVHVGPALGLAYETERPL